MRKILRGLPVLLGVAMSVAAPAQTPWEQGSAFVQNAWKQVQDQGPKAAEAAIRTAPERFRGIQKQLQATNVRVQRAIKQARLEEKKNLALQLWEIRGSLDLMSLLNPDTLEALTGIDAPLLRKLRNETAKLEAMLLGAKPTKPNRP